MSHHYLVCHPETPQSAIATVRASVMRKPDGYVDLGFRAVGDMGQVRWPGDASGGYGPWDRRDGLWQHSCFEAFARPDNRNGYFEVNLATSGVWAAYGFLEYREGMHRTDEVALAAATWSIRAERAELYAKLRAPAEYENSNWVVGLSAVIEAQDGSKSYWALAHPDPDKPDFHHPDCFALTLPPPGGA